MKEYQYTDDTWVDGSEDCPCCSGLTFECYNAVGWSQNGSASNLHELLSQIILAETVDEDYDPLPCFNPYEHFTLQELLDVMGRLNIKAVEVV